MQPDAEFTYSLVILGGLIFAGGLLTLCLVMVGMAIYNRATKKKVIKELYEDKTKTNGRAGSHGKW